MIAGAPVGWSHWPGRSFALSSMAAERLGLRVMVKKATVQIGVRPGSIELIYRIPVVATATLAGNSQMHFRCACVSCGDVLDPDYQIHGIQHKARTNRALCWMPVKKTEAHRSSSQP